MERNLGRSVLKAIFIVATAAILGFAIYFVMQGTYALSVQAGTGEPGFIGGYKPTLIVSGSMEPTIMTNAICVVEKCGIDEVSVGDIVMYRANNGMLIVHRVTNFINLPDGEVQLVTQGDNNTGPDINPVTSSMLKGKITYINNDVAPVITSLFSNSPSGTISILQAIIVLVAIIVIFILLLAQLFQFIQGIWLATAGEKKFNSKLESYTEKVTQSDLDIQSILKSSPPKHNSIVSIIVLGWRRAKILEYIDDSSKYTKKLSKRTSKYISKYTQSSLPDQSTAKTDTNTKQDNS